MPAAQDLHHRSPLHSDTSRPLDKPSNGRIALKVINHLGNEVMKVFKV
jgi:adenine-specific DNA-methyltransferase